MLLVHVNATTAAAVHSLSCYWRNTLSDV